MSTTSSSRQGGEMSGRKRKISTDETNRLDTAVWREIFRFVGKNSYLNVAFTCLRFGVMYREEYDTYKTSAEEMVLTISGAELFLRETNEESRFRIKKSGLPSLVRHRQHRPLEFINFIAALNGRMDLLQWSVSQGSRSNHLSNDCVAAACSGDLTVLQWVQEKGFFWDWKTCATAAYNGDLTMLQWARARGCPWDSNTCALAASNGHFAVLRWARANDCRWDPETCYRAAEKGRLNVLQWARANGCPWDSWTCTFAARNGHLSLLQWARANGCPWDRWTCFYAASNGHLDVLQWARANGCPWDSKTISVAASQGHLDVLEWARENGCPE